MKIGEPVNLEAAFKKSVDEKNCINILPGKRKAKIF
jgi:hypothetical protein